MTTQKPSLASIAIGTIAIAIALASALALYRAGKIGVQSPTRDFLEYKLAREGGVFLRRHFQLVDPGAAPQDIRHLARQGYEILIDTQKYAKDYVGNSRLNCTNCHFAGGDTTGGPQGSISLAGVAAKYPAYDDHLQRFIDLPARINSCFMRSMNGAPLPLDSELMLAIVAYLHWISKDVPIYTPVPWLGLQLLTYAGPGEATRGKKIYQRYCALCHHDDGQGGENAPPLWGEASFNDAAGLHLPDKMAAFIYWNMPYIDTTPVLSEEQAWDVAAYIHAQPRPHYQEK